MKPMLEFVRVPERVGVYFWPPGSDDGPTCVFKCVCHSSCLVGRGRKKPSLILILSHPQVSGHVCVGGWEPIEGRPRRQRCAQTRDSKFHTPEDNCLPAAEYTLV